MQTLEQEKKKCLLLQLKEADQRFNIAISKIQPIKERIDELEKSRTLSLRRDFLINEIEYYKNNPLISEALRKEFITLQTDKRDISIYVEVVHGYKSLSNRKNELEEERNIIVKEIEDLSI